MTMRAEMKKNIYMISKIDSPKIKLLRDSVAFVFIVQDPLIKRFHIKMYPENFRIHFTKPEVH